MDFKLNIRKYQDSDQQAVVQLWKECQLVVPWNDPIKDIVCKTSFQPDLFFVGLINQRLIATCMAGYEGHRGWINYLAVKPDFQGKGFGRSMVEYAELRLNDLGCPKINLQVRETNKGVIQFYTQLGYKDDNVKSLGKRLDKK